MKIFLLLIFLLPIAAFAQSTTDYEPAMRKFQKFYNEGRGDSINAMFGHAWDEMKTRNPIWTNEENASLLEEFGTLKAFKFIGIDTLDPNQVYVFETVFSKGGTRTTSLTLDKDFALGTFRFITSSESIDELLKQSKKGR